MLWQILLSFAKCAISRDILQEIVFNVELGATTYLKIPALTATPVPISNELLSCNILTSTLKACACTIRVTGLLALVNSETVKNSGSRLNPFFLLLLLLQQFQAISYDPDYPRQEGRPPQQLMFTMW
ncbi:hypothetical protein M0802_012380 [Mischocyttarus mexicanus]|nr:hypothetical protein M0802_012380 [Mischocyttarus mexicanus]